MSDSETSEECSLVTEISFCFCITVIRLWLMRGDVSVNKMFVFFSSGAEMTLISCVSVMLCVQIKHHLMSVRAYLCSIRTDPVQSSCCAVQKTDDLLEVIISNTPRTVHQKHQISLSCSTH